MIARQILSNFDIGQFWKNYRILLLLLYSKVSHSNLCFYLSLVCECFCNSIFPLDCWNITDTAYNRIQAINVSVQVWENLIVEESTLIFTTLSVFFVFCITGLCCPSFELNFVRLKVRSSNYSAGENVISAFNILHVPRDHLKRSLDVKMILNKRLNLLSNTYFRQMCTVANI